MTRVSTCTRTVGLVLAAFLVVGQGVAWANSYNLMGFEGVPTLGSGGFVVGPPPPVGDFVTTQCRYIDVMTTGIGEYYLRYFLDLPDGATIEEIQLRIADFNPTGVMWVYLRSRPWNSREIGDTLRFTLSDNTSDNDKLLTISNVNVTVDNSATEYWIDVSPENSTLPGQLCVYGIHVTYD